MDPLLRMYQQTGYLTKGPFERRDGITYVTYHPDEWDEIRQWSDWIEVVHNDKVWRISKREAVLSYNKGSIPLDKFEVGPVHRNLVGDYNRLHGVETLSCMVDNATDWSTSLSDP